MDVTLTIELDEELSSRLDAVAICCGKSRDEVAREALRRHLALVRFEQVRRRVVPFAETAGYLTDDDVFRAVS